MKQSLLPTRTVSPCATGSCRRDGARVNMKFRRSWVWSAAAALLLAACGGGDDAPPATLSPPAPPAASYAVNAAQRHLLTEGGAWSMEGTLPTGEAFMIGMNFAPSTAGPFPRTGATAARSVQTFTVQSAGQSDSVAETIYFDPASLAFFGSEFNGTCNLGTLECRTAGQRGGRRGRRLLQRVGPRWLHRRLEHCRNHDHRLVARDRHWRRAAVLELGIQRYHGDVGQHAVELCRNRCRRQPGRPGSNCRQCAGYHGLCAQFLSTGYGAGCSRAAMARLATGVSADPTVPRAKETGTPVRSVFALLFAAAAACGCTSPLRADERLKAA